MRFGKAASTIHYCEEIGLIPAPVRLGGRRRYRPDAALCECPALDDRPLFDEPASLPERMRSSFAGASSARCEP
jgi:hypothetical protein